MDLAEGIVLFIMIWWVTLFVMLPIGVRSQEEDGHVTPGTERAAPSRPNILKKALWTTGVSILVWLICYGIIVSGVISLQDLDFLPGGELE